MTARIQYVGLSTRPARRFQNHHALLSPLIDSYYLGEITTAGIPGRRPKKVPSDLDAAEHALIYFLQPPLNVYRRSTPPSDCVAVFSRFFGKNNWQKAKPTPEFFPPTISYNSWAGEWHPAMPPQIEVDVVLLGEDAEG